MYENAWSRFCRCCDRRDLRDQAVLIFRVHFDPPICVRNARAASRVGRNLIMPQPRSARGWVFKRMRDTLVPDAPFDPARGGRPARGRWDLAPALTKALAAQPVSENQ
ncbi:hypothetical protein VAPA_1c47480 [Variovorax paradoxus B4]|uniref:Uncharacterized protein n=1 Tax=Variovorax paradoxus B4 TaxID=1246301 RepID=T1XHJ1_VARPD|nr:hypothetical protein VAPA_1c47480 [Variovorax paradoxus B4]